MQSNHTSLGYQVAVDLYGCDATQINAAREVEKHLLHAAALMKCTVINSMLHQFSPIGVSGVVVIAESHIAVHTWPEHGYIALDIFTCSAEHDFAAGIAYLEKTFGASHTEQQTGHRGRMDLVRAQNRMS